MARLVAAIAVVTGGLLALPMPAAESPTGDRGVAPAVTERPAGTLVAVSGGTRLTAIDVETGRRTVRRVRSMAGCGPELTITGDRLVFAGVRGRRTIVLSLPLSLRGAPTRLGAAHAFVPSATPGRVWLAGATCTRSRMGGVRELTVDGRVTSRSRRRVPGSWLLGAVERGLIVQRGSELILWDPRTGGATRLAVEDVADVRGDVLAGCRPGSGCRELAIIDLATGRQATVRPDRGYRLGYGGGEISPDGALLAAPVVRGERWSVAMIDVADGTVDVVRGSRTGTTYPAMSWSASSGWLLFRGRGGRVGAIRPGARRALELPFRLPRGAYGFTAG